MGRRLFLLLFCSAFLLTASAHGEDYNAARHAVASALMSNQNNQALSLLAPLLKTHPQDPSLWTLRGLALDHLGRTKESLTSFDRALSIDADFTPALEGASQAAYLHDDPRASRYVQRLLSVTPQNEIANAMAAALAYQANDCPGAVSYFRRSGDEAYRNERALSEFADCLVKGELFSDAVQILQRGLRLHPESVQLKYNLAVALLQDHHPDKAIHVLEPLTGEKDSELLNLLASAYAQVNRPDDAFRTLENAIMISPKVESNYLDLAILCLEYHQENRSVVAATAGIAKIPDASSLFLIRGVAYAQLADYDKAESDFTMAARLEPNQPHSTIAMSLLYSDRNQLNKEKILLQKQLKSTPDDAVANYLLADLLIRQGAIPGQPEFNEARMDLARSLETKPDSAEAQILMGKLCEQEGNPSQALEHYQSALKVEPDNRSALDREFVLLRKLHRDNEAAEALNHLKSVLNSELEQERAASQVRLNPQHREN
ncbi:MAG: tetratricopeptide repeat protein [Silvibacterium sp.]